MLWKINYSEFVFTNTANSAVSLGCLLLDVVVCLGGTGLEADQTAGHRGKSRISLAVQFLIRQKIGTYFIATTTLDDL